MKKLTQRPQDGTLVDGTLVEKIGERNYTAIDIEFGRALRRAATDYCGTDDDTFFHGSCKIDTCIFHQICPYFSDVYPYIDEFAHMRGPVEEGTFQILHSLARGAVIASTAVPSVISAVSFTRTTNERLRVISGWEP